MKIVTPTNPIKIYMRQGEIADGDYLASNVGFIVVDGPPSFPKVTFVTISGTAIPAQDVAFARVLIDGAWVSHE